MRSSQQLLSPFSLPRILLSLLVVALVIFRIIAMGQNSCAEVGTCRYLVYNGRLHEDDYCPSCRKTLKFGVSYLSRHLELWKGVCFWKYPPADGSCIPRKCLLEEESNKRNKKRMRWQRWWKRCQIRTRQPFALIASLNCSHLS